MYYDTIIKVKNAQMARKESLTVPYSRMDHAVLRALAEKRFVKEVQRKTVGRRSVLEVKLSYEGGKPRIEGVKIVSKPSRRMYRPSAELKPVRQGFGIAILSTSKGVMSNSEARKQKVGGEYLFEIW
ncbi:MAG: 30S ribosomal protein S8 [Candidatus Liptonbacteria bacterium]|nr:30S ribosomal protein S8 [Candidatus Liptonbacteria bacterium]